MARIRSVKPEIRSSEKVTTWPIELRYFWILLWGFCDDHGRGRDNALLIKADAFPLDVSITDEQVEKWMTVLEEAEVIHRYRFEGSSYFSIVNWTEHQKVQHPSKSVIPCLHGVIEQGSCDSHETLVSPSGDAHPRAGSREQGAGSGEASVDAAPSRFCKRHPTGTPNGCGPCADARVLYEIREQKKKDNVPRIPRSKDLIGKYCQVTGHQEYPLEGSGRVCQKCAREQEQVA